MMLSFAATCLACALAGEQENLVELDATQKLSIAWSRAAIQMIYEPVEPTPENYAGSLEVARAAAALDPNESEAWRIVLELAEATSDGIPQSRPAAIEAALQLSKLDPNDLVIRLLRLSDAVDRSVTAEDRIISYEYFLQPASVAKISPLVASRLSFDYSNLLRRRGDKEAALQKLRNAIALDPAYPAATARLAAHQIESAAPPGIIANALVDAILANPSDIPLLKELGLMCLREGLYTEADLILGVACRVANKNFRNDIYDGLIELQMLARWGLGNHKQSADLYQKRQQQLMSILRRKGGGGRTEDSIAMSSTMSEIYAMVCKCGSLPGAESAFDDSLRIINDEIKSSDGSPDVKTTLILRKIWLALGIAPQVDDVPLWIEEVEALSPLTNQAKLKLNGWLKLREGKADEAIAILQPLAEQNNAARFGYALALAKIGKSKEAAKEFVTITRSTRGEAIGMYAADQLFQILKTRPSASAVASEIQSATARLPKNFAVFAKDESEFVNLKVEFLSTTAAPFESLPCKIEVSNISPIPMDITPEGPIDSRAAIRLEVVSVGTPPQNLEPIIFPINRKLQLQPNETMSFVLNIARTPVAMGLVTHPLDGVNLQIELLNNFKLTLESLLPGFLGRVTLKNSIRISPVIRNTAWREEALGNIRHCDKPEDLVTLVLFAFDLASRRGESGAAEEVKEGWAEVERSWSGLSPAAQAWALMVLPREPLDMTEPIAKKAKESQDVRVQMSTLLRWVDSENDEFLNTIARGGNQQLITVADSVRSWIEGKVREASKLNESLEEAGILGGVIKASDTAPAKQP